MTNELTNEFSTRHSTKALAAKMLMLLTFLQLTAWVFQTVKKPRQLLVKFRNMYTVDKIQARASMLKTYEPRYMGVNYAVFISKSLNKDEQEKEQQLLKRRRELLNNGSDPKSIKIRKGVLLNNRAETTSD